MSPLDAMAEAVKGTMRRFGRGDLTEEFALFTARAALRALRENVSEEMVKAVEVSDDGAQSDDVRMIITAALLTAEQSGSLTDGERG